MKVNILCSLPFSWQVFSDKLVSSMQTVGDYGNLLVVKAVSKMSFVCIALCDQFHQATDNSLQQPVAKPFRNIHFFLAIDVCQKITGYAWSF